MTNKDKLIELENKLNEFDKRIKELWGLYDSFPLEDKGALANKYLHTNNH